MTDTAAGTELATLTPDAALNRYADSFTNSLPSHVVKSQWLAVARGALRDPKVNAAAANDPGSFLYALLTASRLGLEPGTEQFYLVPQPAKRGGPPVIRGNVGYQGLVELIYRAGAVSSVIVETVHAADTFDYVIGHHVRPIHRIDWDAADRGALRLVYAYAIMRDGATSKVVVLNRADIGRIMAANPFSTNPNSPWQKHPAAMWLKTATRQLAKWVPTSAEFRRQQLRDAQAVMDERANGNTATLPEFATPTVDEAAYIDPLTGEIVDTTGDDSETTVETDIVDAEIVPAAGGISVMTESPSAAPDRDGGAPGEGLSGAAPPSTTVPVAPVPLLGRQSSALRVECSRLGIQANPDEKRFYLSYLVGRELDGPPPGFGLTRTEADTALTILAGFPDRGALEQAAGNADTLPAEDES